MRVVVVGAGLMGAPIGCEYALGGHEVVFVARRPGAARQRIEETLGLAADLDLASAAALAAAARSLVVQATQGEIEGTVDLVVESVVERLGDKIEVLGEAARRFPDAILASNTSSLSITTIGDGAGAPERTVGTHYWNPPLLMPLVEVVRGDRTSAAPVERMAATLRDLGKRPVLVERDVPGFVWNRLQLALLREAAWLVEQGVASAVTVDEVVRDGLARRWRYAGPFQTVALGGAETFERIAANLFPVLSDADRLPDLGRWLEGAAGEREALRARRDRGLVDDLRRDRSALEAAVPSEGAVGRAASTEGAPW